MCHAVRRLFTWHIERVTTCFFFIFICLVLLEDRD